MADRNQPQMWIMKITPGEPNRTEEYFDALFNNNNPVNLIGYTKGSGEKKSEDFWSKFNRIKEFDIIVVMGGLDRVVGCVMAESNNVSQDISRIDCYPDWFEYRKKASILERFDPPFQPSVGINQNTINEANPGTNTKQICDEVWDRIQNIYATKKQEKMQKDEAEHLNKFRTILTTNTPQLILEGPPGTGKTREAKRIANWLVSNGLETGQAGDNTKVDTLQWATDNGQIQFTQFHPAYNYDDFIRGLVPQKSNDGSISFEPQDKVLLRIAKKARKYPETTYVLIIDEINRANLPEVMGELIYALEYRGEPFNVVYPESFESGNYQEYIPGNLYIIGTMNTADRSVGTLDYAIRRRFVFERLPPDRNVITSEKAENLFKKVEKLFDQENEEYNCYLSPEFDKNDVMLGHSYFLAEDDDQLSINLEYKIKPILREYVKDGVLIDNQNGEEALCLIKKLQL